MNIQIIKDMHIINIIDADTISEISSGKYHINAKWNPKSNTQEHLHLFIDNQHILSTFDLYISAEDIPSFKILS